MKSKTWGLLLAAVFVICLGLSVWLFRPRQAGYAEIWSDGALYTRVDLRKEQTFTVEGAGGRNTITVKDGKIAVTAASCPDHFCVDRGFRGGGADIVCLPNRLVIKLVGKSQALDGAVG